MKHILTITIVLVVAAVLATAKEARLGEGDYILAYDGEKWRIDPEVVSLTKKDDGTWNLPLKIEGLSATSSVHVVSAEYQEYPEVFVSAITRVPETYRQVGNERKVGSYAIIALTLHGKLGSDGIIRGVFVKTRGGAGAPPLGPSVQQGRFVLKPLKAQQDGADQPATAPESKSKGKEKPEPKSDRRPQ